MPKHDEPMEMATNENTGANSAVFSFALSVLVAGAFMLGLWMGHDQGYQKAVDSYENHVADREWSCGLVNTLSPPAWPLKDCSIYDVWPAESR